MKEMKEQSNAKKCKKEEVWLVPSPEVSSPWDSPFITKEMFTSALGLQLTDTGEMTPDDDALLEEESNDVNENVDQVNTIETEEMIKNIDGHDSDVSEIEIEAWVWLPALIEN